MSRISSMLSSKRSLKRKNQTRVNGTQPMKVPGMRRRDTPYYTDAERAINHAIKCRHFTLCEIIDADCKLKYREPIENLQHTPPAEQAYQHLRNLMGYTEEVFNQNMCSRLFIEVRKATAKARAYYKMKELQPRP